MTLPDGEPRAEPWRVVPLTELLDLVLQAAGGPTGRPRIVAVDGRGAGGKSTIAARLAAAADRGVVVHTDDIAWHHSFFGWDQLLRDGVLLPVRRGEAVEFRPPPWDERGRAGAISVPPDTTLLVIEGVGAGRREVADLLDAVVWVQSDFAEAERRGIARDVERGDQGSAEEVTAFWFEWMAEELPFQAGQRPWERACIIVAGTPPRPMQPDEVAIADAPKPPLRWRSGL